MLLEFRVDNYLSFKEEMSFSMEAGARLRKYKESNSLKVSKYNILKNAVIFGPNGSGKSNLFIAMHRMKSMILNPTKKSTSLLPYTPFLLNESGSNRATEFYMHFIHLGNEYKYSFKYLRNRFVEEKLIVVVGGKENIHINRVLDKEFVVPSVLEDLKERTRDNSLFLFNAQNNNDKHAKNVMGFFENQLIFSDEGNSDDLYKMLRDDNNKKIFLKLMKYADFNIIDVKVEEEITRINKAGIKKLIEAMNMDVDVDVDLNLNEATEHIRYKLALVYKRYNSDGNLSEKNPTSNISLEMESSGTRRMIDLALNILFTKNSGKTLIIDEFDSVFHPNLAKALIELFNSKNNKNQFIVTTHELNILECPLRKDQIYFLEKDYDGQSIINSLFDYNDIKPRADISYLKNYLDGEFGAIPMIDNEKLLETLSGCDVNV